MNLITNAGQCLPTHGDHLETRLFQERFGLTSTEAGHAYASTKSFDAVRNGDFGLTIAARLAVHGSQGDHGLFDELQTSLERITLRNPGAEDLLDTPELLSHQQSDLLGKIVDICCRHDRDDSLELSFLGLWRDMRLLRQTAIMSADDFFKGQYDALAEDARPS